MSPRQAHSCFHHVGRCRTVLGRLVPAVLVACLVAGSAALGAAPSPKKDPPWYQRKATWLETLRAAEAAFAEAMKRPNARGTPLPDFGRDDFTAAAWVRTRRGGTVVAKAPAEGTWTPQAKALFIRGGRLTYDIGWVGSLSAPPPLADGAWHHVALVKKGRTLALLVDGKVAKRGSLEGKADPAEAVLKLGMAAKNFPQPQSGLVGELDEVVLLGRALSEAEVKALAEGAAPAKTAGLVAYWPFENGLADASGRGHDAYAQGGRAALVEGKRGKAVRLDGRTALVVGGEAGFAQVWGLLARDFPGVEPLFDGRTLSGWRRMNRPGHGWGAVWEVQDGAIVGVQEWPGSRGILASRRAFGDVDLRLQVRTEWPVDAAVLVRMDRFEGGYEVTLYGRDEGGDIGGVACGGFFDRVHRKAKGWEAVWKKDDWNDLRVTVRGQPPVVRTWVNGKPMMTLEAKDLKLDEPPPARGAIGLKIAGPEASFNHRVFFRYIRVRPLE